MLFHLGKPIEEVVALNVNQNSSVDQAKRQISKIVLIPANCIQISFQDKILPDDFVLKNISSQGSTPLDCQFLDVARDQNRIAVEPPPDILTRVQYLVNMGFPIRNVYAALMESNYETEKAIRLLLQGMTNMQTNSQGAISNASSWNSTNQQGNGIKLPQISAQSPGINFRQLKPQSELYSSLSLSPQIVYLLENGISEDMNYITFIEQLNSNLPRTTLDCKLLVQEYKDKKGNIDEVVKLFPGYTKGYLVWILNTICRMMSGRNQLGTKWTYHEERFLSEMYHLGIIGQKVDIILKKSNESSTKWKNVKRFLKSSPQLESFLNKSPSCAMFDPGYDKIGLPIYLNNLIRIIKNVGGISLEDALKYKQFIQSPQEIENFSIFSKIAAKNQQQAQNTQQPLNTAVSTAQINAASNQTTASYQKQREAYLIQQINQNNAQQNISMQKPVNSQVSNNQNQKTQNTPQPPSNKQPNTPIQQISNQINTNTSVSTQNPSFNLGFKQKSTQLSSTSNGLANETQSALKEAQNSENSDNSVKDTKNSASNTSLSDQKPKESIQPSQFYKDLANSKEAIGQAINDPNISPGAKLLLARLSQNLPKQQNSPSSALQIQKVEETPKESTDDTSKDDEEADDGEPILISEDIKKSEDKKSDDMIDTDNLLSLQIKSGESDGIDSNLINLASEDSEISAKPEEKEPVKKEEEEEDISDPVLISTEFPETEEKQKPKNNNSSLIETPTKPIATVSQYIQTPLPPKAKPKNPLKADFETKYGKAPQPPIDFEYLKQKMALQSNSQPPASKSVKDSDSETQKTNKSSTNPPNTPRKPVVPEWAHQDTTHTPQPRKAKMPIPPPPLKPPSLTQQLLMRHAQINMLDYNQVQQLLMQNAKMSDGKPLTKEQEIINSLLTLRLLQLKQINPAPPPPSLAQECKAKGVHMQWTVEEEKVIIQQLIFNKMSKYKWKKIADVLPGRNPKGVARHVLRMIKDYVDGKKPELFIPQDIIDEYKEQVIKEYPSKAEMFSKKYNERTGANDGEDGSDESENDEENVEKDDENEEEK
ncbi:UBA/TS-N domain containing protein [Trichomonas vaginalis G3]|uniref:UBA/TS-N domain containing protein n=1 Tax=Trichomonas vaginalis (strain ATCC PRA-98 / G3) TaxID=412133 RepID=A2DLD7_TRIV3|nr:homeodomain-like family [Trichomonas vaginalis G3]EAY18755.1 UBA/TS-N domain containing protein [Trichomonas vaginalis G3]KAI5539309.1 homeodomain-like family [Trichomonas vaginalis G3]|eukprot:XP_001579741.1 UBA/TS-N domain containing protein [Trichomonas vaginalis G3]